MREMVDQVYGYMWAFSRRAGIAIDPLALRASIEQQLNGALRVVTAESLTRLGHVKLAVMIETAVRYDLTLAELLNEALQSGYDATASLCRGLQSRKATTQRLKRRPTLTRIK